MSSDAFKGPIARLGCGIHQNLPSFRTLTHSALHQSIARSLGYGDPRVTQSQVIAKLAGVGGRIGAHQDGGGSFTDPPTAVTFWYALEDATLANGCLQVAAGSHLTEPLTQRMVKGENGDPTFVDLPQPAWAASAAAVGAGVAEPKANQHQQSELQVTKTAATDTGHEHEYEYTPLEVKQGTLIIFHGNLLHKSGENTSAKDRLAYNFTVIDGDSSIPEDTYLKPEGEGSSGEFVSLCRPELDLDLDLGLGLYLGLGRGRRLLSSKL